MFKKPVKLFASLNNLSAVLKHKGRYESTKIGKNHKWDLFSAVCIERHPLITKPMNEIEKKYQEMIRQIEYENSMKNDHELRYELEKNELELQKKGLLEVELEYAAKQSAQDIEDTGDIELAAFKFAPRITEADKKNIKTSLERKLDKCLVLLVEQKIGKDCFWLPPQGNRIEGETMREAAERVLKEACGDKLNVQIYGNAPMGVYKYAYPKSIRENGSYGAKVFYYLAKYLSGGVPESVKHQWLDRQELEKIMPPPVHKSVSKFLLSE